MAHTFIHFSVGVALTVQWIARSFAAVSRSMRRFTARSASVLAGLGADVFRSMNNVMRRSNGTVSGN